MVNRAERRRQRKTERRRRAGADSEVTREELREAEAEMSSGILPVEVEMLDRFHTQLSFWRGAQAEMLRNEELYTGRSTLPDVDIKQAISGYAKAKRSLAYWERRMCDTLAAGGDSASGDVLSGQFICSAGRVVMPDALLDRLEKLLDELEEEEEAGTVTDGVVTPEELEATEEEAIRSS